MESLRCDVTFLPSSLPSHQYCPWSDPAAPVMFTLYSLERDVAVWLWSLYQKCVQLL
uniref:Uncharacterized protein n=1 Tax=Anguilla anguilla TaxID=7936 RepID=A0A0E9XXQ0_ANGAN